METYHEDDKDEENTSAPSERPVPRMPEGILFFDRHRDDMVRGFDPFKEKSDKDDRNGKKKDKAKTDKTGKTIVEPEHRAPAPREVARPVPLPWPEIVPRPIAETSSDAETTDEDQDATISANQASPTTTAHLATEADGVFAVYKGAERPYIDSKSNDPARSHAQPIADFGMKPGHLPTAQAPEFVRVTPHGTETPFHFAETAHTNPPTNTGEHLPPEEDPLFEEIHDSIARLKAKRLETEQSPSDPSPTPGEWEQAWNAAMDPYQTQAAYGTGGGGEWTPTPAMPIERPKHEPIYDNRPRGVAAVAALLGLEHLGRKRADKKQTELIRENAKQQQELVETQQRMAEQQRRAANEQYQQAKQIEQLRSGQFATQTGERFTSAPSAEYGSTAAAVRHETAPVASGMPAIHERIAPVPGARVETQHNKPLDLTLAEQLPPEAIESVQLQPKQRVEHSSWHNIVVERGHAVEDAIKYGEGFQRERQQEILSDQIANAGVTSTHSAPASTHTAYPSAPYASSLPSGMTTPSLPQGMPTHVDPQHQLPADTKKSAGGLWFWLMLAIVIAAFFTAAFI